jgi:hypothetical protein
MNNPQTSDGIFEVLFEQAVIDNFHAKLGLPASGEGPAGTYTFSAAHEARMERLFAHDARKEKLHTAAKWCGKVAAMVVLAFVALSSVALAVSTARGYDIGHVGRIGRIYDSFFSDPSEKDAIEVGQSAVNNGIEVALLSAYTDGQKVYAMIELTDTTGNRLSDSIEVRNNSFDYSYYLLNLGTTVYDGDANKARLGVTLNLFSKVSLGDVIALKIDEIVSMANGEEQSIAGPWSISFAVGKVITERSLYAPVPNSPYYGSIEVSCSPLRTSVILYNNDSEKEAAEQRENEQYATVDEALEWVKGRAAYIDSFGAPYLTLDDGRTIELMLGGSGWSSDKYSTAMGFDGEYFDIGSLRSLTILGEVYYFEDVS